MFKKLIALLLMAISAIGLCSFGLSGCKNNKKNDVRYTGETYGVGAYSGLDDLAKLKPDLFFEQQSSYDRDGGNADGFGLVLPDGKNESGEENESAIKRVLLSLNSPGVVYRMFFTNFGDVPNLRIYIDGKKTVDMSLADLTSGKNYPFVYPFVQNKTQSSGGLVCYLPIAFAKSIEIIGSGNFYCNISYHIYPADAEIESFSNDINLDDAKRILSSLGEDPKYKSDNTIKKEKISLDVSSQKSISIQGKRSISSITLKIPDVTAVKYDRTVHSCDGLKLAGGRSMSFDLAVSDGAVLNGRYFLGKQAQTANLYVDDKKIGTIKVRARRQDGFEWKDNDYFMDIAVALPNSAIAGKNKVRIKIEATSEISFFKLSAVVSGKTVDSIDFGNEKSKKEHSVQSGSATTVHKDAEYDPNSLISSSKQKKIYAVEDMLNSLKLKIYYDGEKTPRVNAPVSAFFGFGMFGAYETKTLMCGIKADGTMYSYFPMPFESKCVIELVNEGKTKITDAELTIAHKPESRSRGEYGYFSTQYSEYINGTATALRAGEYFDILKENGSGHLVGVGLSMTGNYFGETSRYYLEGDEVLYVDGNKSFTAHGTGTEDFFNGGWYFNNGTQVNALYGNTAHNTRNGLDRTAMIRNMVADCITFRNGIHLMMEHGGNNNRTDSNVYALAYYYHSDKAILRETDNFLISSPDANGYEAVQAENKRYTGTGEALYKKKSYTNVYSYVSGESSFEVGVDSGNSGVILRRLMNSDILGQRAAVYVDGEYVGVWNERFRAALNYVRWEDYYIPAKFTAGKSKLKIKIVNLTAGDDSIIPWTESEYTVYSVCR